MTTTTACEFAAILAGLRLLQRELEHGPGLPAGIGEIPADAGAPLTSQEIDALCDRLNTAKPQMGNVVLPDPGQIDAWRSTIWDLLNDVLTLDGVDDAHSLGASLRGLDDWLASHTTAR